MVLPDPITIALATVGWVTPTVLKELGAKFISYLGTDIAKEFEDLETILLPQFQLTIDAAKRSNQRDWVDKWMKRLEKAYSDVHKILQEYEHLESSRSSSSTSALQGLVHLVKNKTSLLSLRNIRLLKRLNKLKKVAAEAKTLRDLLATAINSPEILTTAHLPHKNILGRNEDRENIIKFLLNKQTNTRGLRSYSVVAITGMLGAGKTTLAQYVYNDPRVVHLYKSGVRMWLSLSQTLDISECTKQMIEFTTDQTCPQYLSFSKLQGELKRSSLLMKNILIILDNVCYENNDRNKGKCNWELLLTPFADREEGTCKIVLTSRSSSFPIALHPEEQIDLGDLPPDDFKSLLKYHAIDHLKIRNPQLNDLPIRNHIVDLIAEKMCQSPYAAKVVGNELCNKKEIAFWEDYYEKVSKSFQKIVYFS